MRNEELSGQCNIRKIAPNREGPGIELERGATEGEAGSGFACHCAAQ
jgi:hypothetical protein